MQKLIIFIISITVLFIQHILYNSCLKYQQLEEVKLVIGKMNSLATTLYYDNAKQFKNAKQYREELNRSRYSNNLNYCSNSDTMKFFHPDIILQDIYSARESTDLTKEIIQRITFDVISINDNSSQNKNRSIVPDVLTIPFNYYDWYLTRTTTGQNAMCLFQKNNHMRGRQSLAYKNELLNNHYKYLNTIKQKKLPDDCVNNITYIPKSYRLYLKNECLDFFSYVNSSEYKTKFEKEGPQFISKLGLEVHRGAGIKMLFKKQLIELQLKYQQGQLCGNISDYLIAQKYINNPYLFKGHKIEFRIYFIIASTNPMIVYAYDSSLIRRCAAPFDKFSLEKSSHVCNTAIVKQTVGADALQDDEQFFINWKLDYLQQLLLKQKKIKSKKWLEQSLYPKIHRTIQHLILSTEQHFQKDSKLGEFFGVDFMLTNDLNVYVLEVNSNPQLLKTTPQRIQQNTKLVIDILEIQVAYLRSKYIRLRKLIFKVLQNKLSDQQIKSQFENAYLDKLEPGITIRDSNLFRKIIDRNLNDSRAYNDLIQKKCLI